MPPIALDIDGHVATLTIQAEGGLLDGVSLEALAARAADLAAAVDEVRAVVVRSAGADFCVGLDAPEARSLHGAAFDALAAVPQPVVAAVHGRAHSAGLELALACDIRVASEDASFAMPETGEGLVPSGGGTQRLPRAVGRAQALRLLLTGEQIDAAEAKRIGLVSRVTAPGAVAETALELARVIASRGPVATRMAKEAVHRGSEMPLAQALRYELDLTVLLQTTADRAEGVRAFAARRPAEFTGH